MGAVDGGGPRGDGAGVHGAFWKPADRGCLGCMEAEKGCLGADRRRGARAGGGVGAPDGGLVSGRGGRSAVASLGVAHLGVRAWAVGEGRKAAGRAGGDLRVSEQGCH